MTLDVHKHLTHARWYVSKLLTHPSGKEAINSKRNGGGLLVEGDWTSRHVSHSPAHQSYW